MNSRFYLSGFAVSAFFALVVSYFITWSVQVADCAVPERPSAFVSACANPAYGDYEHGAFYIGLERAAIEKLKAAKVVFLGSSRTQFAFSTESTRSFFRDLKVPYYLLGFGYVEQVGFGQELLRRYHLRPDVIVINLDPYFSSYVSPMATSLMNHNLEVWRQYLFKGLMPATKPAVCALFDCTPTRAIHRDGTNGEWIWADVFLPPASGHPKKFTEPNFSAYRMNDMLKYGRLFLELTSIRPECLVLTTIPNDRFDFTPEAQAVAEAMGARAIIPSMTDIVMVDEDHLNLPTAERWSRDFLAQLGSTVTKCVPR